MAVKPDSSSAGEAELFSGRMQFHYVKGTAFRHISPSGALLELSPTRNVSIYFFSERPPLPQLVVQNVKDGQLVVGEAERFGKEGVVRDVEFVATMDLGTARELASALNASIRKLEAAAALDPKTGGAH